MQDGVVEAVEVENAAVVALAGLDVTRFLTSDDPLELAVMLAIAKRVNGLRELEREDLAVRIRNQIVEAIG